MKLTEYWPRRESEGAGKKGKPIWSKRSRSGGRNGKARLGGTISQRAYARQRRHFKVRFPRRYCILTSRFYLQKGSAPCFVKVVDGFR